MARPIEDIERDISTLSEDDRRALLRLLIAELDTPAESGMEKAWLEESQRRYRELTEGKVDPLPGPMVFERLRFRLRE